MKAYCTRSKSKRFRKVIALEKAGLSYITKIIINTIIITSYLMTTIPIIIKSHFIIVNNTIKNYIYDHLVEINVYL